MNPYGFVAAASMASQTSMSRSWANNASSFTSATLTCRKVFYSSLASSAARQVDTRTVVRTKVE